MDKKSKDDLFHLLVRAAIQEDIENSEKIQNECELEEYVFSDDFNKKMDKLFKKERHRQWIKKNWPKVYKIVTVAASITIVSGILVTSVDALRLPVSNFLWNITEKYTDVTPEIIHYGMSQEMEKYMPQFIPDRFVITDVNEQKDEVCVTYENDEGKAYIVDFWMNVQSTAVDTEDAAPEEVIIQNIPATIVEKQDRTYIIWIVHGHQYFVEGYITREEGIRILESVNINN